MAEPPTTGEICEILVELQRRRRHAIGMQSRIDRSTDSYLARLSGYHSGLPEAERKKIWTAVARFRATAERGGEDHCNGDTQRPIVLAAAIPIVIIGKEVRGPADRERDAVEAEMVRLARLLPVWSWVDYTVRGLGPLGLAVIVGEAGDLALYANPAKLWKRLGLAVFDGACQGRLPPGFAGDSDDRKAAWRERGYKPQRRAEIWAFLDDVMLRAQWRRATDDNPARALGPYGALWQLKKLDYQARGWSKLHCDRAARRYAVKRLIVDLWKAWGALGRTCDPRLACAPMPLEGSDALQHQPPMAAD